MVRLVFGGGGDGWIGDQRWMEWWLMVDNIVVSGIQHGGWWWLAIVNDGLHFL